MALTALRLAKSDHPAKVFVNSADLRSLCD